MDEKTKRILTRIVLEKIDRTPDQVEQHHLWQAYHSLKGKEKFDIFKWAHKQSLKNLFMYIGMIAIGFTVVYIATHLPSVTN